MEEPGGLQSIGSQRVGHNWATSLSLSSTVLTALHYYENSLAWWKWGFAETETQRVCETGGRGKWQPTPIHLPEKSHGQRGLVGYSPWCHKRVGHLPTKRHHTFSKSVNSSSGQIHSLPPTIKRRKKKSSNLVFVLLFVIQSPLRFSFQVTPPNT